VFEPFIAAARPSGAEGSLHGGSEIDTVAPDFHSEWMMHHRMKASSALRALPLAILAVAFLTLSRPARAQEEVTVKGEILDMTCYLSKGSKGDRHKTCAKMCAKKGLPIGVLTDEGKVFLLIEDHDDPDPYEAVKDLAGGQAEITGKRYSKDGIESIMVGGSKGL
jgi:hypothetical protein